MRNKSKKSLGLWIAAVVITAGIAVLLILNAHFENLAGAKRVGVRLDIVENRLVFVAVSSGLPADRAGVSAGDALLAINGEPVNKLLDYDRAMRTFKPGGGVVFSVRRGAETLDLTVRPGADFPWLRYFSVLGPTLAYLALGLLCLLHWRQDLRARLLAILVLAIAIELALPAIIIGEPLLLTISTALFFLLTGTQIAVEFHLISLIPARAPWILRWPRLVSLVYVLGLGFGGGLAAAIMFNVLSPRNGITAVTDLGFDSLNVILPFWALSIGAMLIYQMIHYPSPRGRQQAGLVLVGIAPWIFVTLLETAVLLKYALLPEWWFSASNWALITFPIAVFVAIFRHQLFDLELVVRRSLVYGTVTTLLIGVFYAVLAAAWPLAVNIFGSTVTPWVITGAALALGIIATRVRARVEHAIEVRVFPERHALRRHLIRLAASLPVHGKLPLMGSHLANDLCLAFRTRSSTIVMVDPLTQLPYSLASSRTDSETSKAVAALFRTDPRLEQLLSERAKPIVTSRLPKHHELADRLDALGVEVIAPLLSHDSFIGAMCLGSKNTGSIYPGEELELLNLLSHHVTSAFENARLAEHATYERLTGLYRREVILDILRQECARAIQCSEPIAVAMIDIDHFKETNDAHGHLAGDRILQRVAGTIRSTLRSTDMVGRYGGEEFLAVMPNTDLDGAREAAEHVRVGIESLRVPLDNGVITHASVSIGLAALNKATGSAEGLSRAMIETADQYLYEAKQNGRNRVIAKRHTAGAV